MIKIKIHGYTFKPESLKDAHLLWRIYETKEIFRYPNGRVAPQPGTWTLAREITLSVKRGRITIPTLELAPTTERGVQFYNLVLVDQAGREKWHADDELTLPVDLPDEFEGQLDFPSWLLYNLERKGVIAPGQLHD